MSLPKMKPEVKKLWVDALRSGNYEQGQGFLRTTDNKYCCLGVLCDVSSFSLWKSNTAAHPVWAFDGAVTTLPLRVQRWAQLDTDNPVLVYEGDDQTLVVLNDGDPSKSLTFEKIADLIEEQL